MSYWRPDILGDGFECMDLELGIDGTGDGTADGESDGDTADLVATLVRSLPEPLGLWQRLLGRRRALEDVDVLYVHGWSDYFFQRGMARFFTDRGARFFALDLRCYGRSLRDGQSPGYTENLADYDAEIGQALAVMGHRVEAGESADAGEPGGPVGSKRRLLLFGHSTGGLILSLWSDRHRGIADGLLLNSPWLALQLSDAVRRALAPVVNLRARLTPHELAVPHLDIDFYRRAQSLVSDPDEQAGINLLWRPEHTRPVLAGWLSAILAGHARIGDGIDVGAPVCVLLSRHTYFGLTWRDEMASGDTVLDVENVARAALRLGSSVTVERIDGALHDVFLSERSVRDEAYRRTDRWLRGWIAAAKPLS